MNIIALHGIYKSPDSVDHMEKVASILTQNNRKIIISEPLAGFCIRSFRKYDVYNPGDDLSSVEAVFSLGGDGTLLESLTHVGKSMVPILGINLGRLGFLATISKENIESALNSYFKGDFDFDDRSLLKLISENPLLTANNYALNEIAILRKDTSAMIAVKTFLNGEYLNSYWADGLMVSTPTGSTGYSLSCGGPVLMPQTKDFVITPVSPHNLNVRPLIVSDESELTFSVESRIRSFLVSMDSRSIPVEGDIVLTIRKAEFHARLIRIKGISFLDTLRNKLIWGMDRRN